MASRQTDDRDGPITIKKYANRRLYNTATSSYVTLDHLCQMVQDGIDFVVYDAKTGEDITRTVLTQIIVEEEAKGANLLPIKFLRQLIGFYGDSMQWMVPRYLDHMMETFATNQERLRQSMQDAFGGLFPFANLEEMSKQNIALFENAMKMFTPFPPAGKAAAHEHAVQPDNGATGENAGKRAEAEKKTLDDLKAQVDLLQKRIEEITREDPKRKS
ncbi:MAG: polyhydroxyalkanoate synthesis repressor PhaR [Alphaproteobacteria bacterium]|nr:MAG: polyhydroxyalkanoate synthesis repressor PhaR [Alphaproteobacteria bacterium]